jgi:hypothetical protein
VEPGLGWTDVAFKIIWDATKINCPLVLRYKNHTTLAEGKCPDKNCSTSVLLILVHSSDAEVRLRIEVFDYNAKLVHVKAQRRTRYALRESYRKQLKIEKPYNLLNKIRASNYRDGNPPNPPHIPNLKVLQKISGENKKSPGDVVKNLFELNLKEKVFRALNLEDEVTIIYWHKLQQNFYLNYAKSEYTILSLDDTGNIVNNLHGDSRKCDELNLFQLQLEIKSQKSQRMGQMLSSRKDKFTILNFLNKWLDDFVYSPKECVMDGAGALHWAVCKTFNECELSEYLKYCYRLVNGEETEWKFNTLLRLDTFHFVQMLRRFSRKHKIDKSIKSLFLRSLVLSVTLTNFTELHIIFTCVILIANQKKESKETLLAKNLLQKFITTNEVGSAPVNVSVNIKHDWVSSIVEEIRTINCKEMVIKNTHYFPELVSYLCYVGRLAYMWSNVIPAMVGSEKLLASSNIVESSFSVLKRTVLKGSVATCDDYIESSIDEIIGQFSKLPSILTNYFNITF